MNIYIPLLEGKWIFQSSNRADFGIDCVVGLSQQNSKRMACLQYSIHHRVSWNVRFPMYFPYIKFELIGYRGEYASSGANFTNSLTWEIHINGSCQKKVRKSREFLKSNNIIRRWFWSEGIATSKLSTNHTKISEEILNFFWQIKYIDENFSSAIDW